MDLLGSKFSHSPSNFELSIAVQEPPKGNPFADTVTGPLFDLLKETSDLQASLQRSRERVDSVTRKKAMEALPTPGRPIFSFTVGNHSRKSIPSKWDNAEKWLMKSSSTDSSGHRLNPAGAEKSRVSGVKVSKTVSSFDSINGGSDVLLKDRFEDDRGSEQSKEEFRLKNTVKDRSTVQHEDDKTEMTPIGSSTTSRCPTPFKTTSPARHNTPTPVHGNAVVHTSQLQERPLAQFHLGSQYDFIASNWRSREEEEEEISKNLRHFETGKESREIVSQISKVAVWEEDEKSESCRRYQREEAKIQAWVNLENAKAEAQSRKLDVKIQKMRSNLEEKLMKKMGVVHRKAEERRAAARQQHAEKMIGSVFPSQTSGGCFCGDN